MNITNENQKTGLSDEQITDSMKELISLIRNSKDEKLAFDFITSLLTTPEFKAIGSRWLIVKEIDKGTTQREIARNFSMSLCKITRGSKELNKPDSAFRKMLELLKKN